VTPDPPLNPRIALYAACFSRAMQRDCPPDERALMTAAMEMIVPAAGSTRRPHIRTFGDLIREAIDERLHGEP
jgi:hypothetical protein